MLARHAESLFWAGRYLERAQDTARLLDVAYHSQIEARPRQARQAWLELLQVLSLDGAYSSEHETVDAEGVNDFLVLDPRNPGAVVTAVGRAREDARSVRELLSNDLWLAINDLHLGLRARDVRFDLDQHPGQFYAYVKKSCQAVMGVASETMPRTDGWRFFILGVLIERAEMTCRLLEVFVGRVMAADSENRPDLARVLESASATEAYLRRFSATSTTADAVAFLLLSPTFPRSVFYCITQAEGHLAALDGPGEASPPRRRLGRFRADLEFLDVGELMTTDLPAYLATLQGRTLEVADEITDLYFSGDVRELQLQEWRGGPNIGFVDDDAGLVS